MRIIKEILKYLEICSSGDSAQKIFLAGVQKLSSVLTTWECCTRRTRPTHMWMVATHASVGSMEEPVQEDSVLRKRFVTNN